MPDAHAPSRPRPRAGLGVRAQLLLVVGAVVVPFLAALGVRTRERADAARASAKAQAVGVARLVRSRVEERASAIQALLAATAHAIRPDSGAIAFNDSTLLAIKAQLGAAAPVTNLWAFDARGHNIGTSRRPLPERASVFAGDRRYFREAFITRQPTVGDPVRSRPEGRWSVQFAQPLLDASGEVRAMIVGTLHLPSLDRTFADAQLPPDAVATLLDANGVVIGRSARSTEWIGRTLHGPAGMRDLRERGEGTTEFRGADGVARLAAYTHIPALRWAVVVQVPSSAAFAPVQRELRRDLLLGFVSLAIAVGLAVLVARRVVRPLEALAQDAQALAAGDFARRSDVGAPGELGTLGRAFNEMATTIAARTADLHRSEQRYRLLFDASPLPMYLVDLSTYRFLAVNQAAIEQYGYTREEFGTLTLLDIRPAEDRLKFLAVARSLGKAQSYNDRSNAGVWRHLRKDGSTLDVEIFTAITEYEGKPARLSVAADVTARRLAERALQDSQEQLRRAQKMEALGRFAGGIAHDFNNLLTGILGYCDLALADVSDAGTREDFEAIRAAAQRAASLTGQILAFSRGNVVQPVALDLDEVVRDFEPMLSRVIGEHIRLDVRTARADGGTDAVLADRGQLEQVVMNLALNARDAMPEGGTLTLATRAVSVQPADPEHPGVAAGRWIVLDVVDTGVGMDAETQARIFEPFFTTKPRGRGTGLGLATVYGIVQQGGGTVRVRSAPRQGSTFSVYLPRTDAPVELRRTEVAPGAPRGGRETILLVEDEEAVRAIARETLERLGYLVLVAEDGPSAVERARGYEAPIDLLLTDVVMPGMHGRELAELLQRDRRGMRVMFMSGYTEDDVLHRGISTDAVAFVPKPFTPDVLGHRVREVLDADDAPALVASDAAAGVLP